MPRRSLLVLGLAAALTAPAAAAAQDVTNPPKIPSSPKQAKHRCTNVTKSGGQYEYKVWVIRGKVSCATARKVVRTGLDNRGFTYFDWTKGGNGRWSDVWAKDRNRTVVGADLFRF